ncbi:hypothetical protein DFH06DRAFT_1427208 [Mycena polygramma]|nr:hypothetical protein DFH06DRAFT_1427208 [Mycena polygramma]
MCWPRSFCSRCPGSSSVPWPPALSFGRSPKRHTAPQAGFPRSSWPWSTSNAPPPAPATSFLPPVVPRKHKRPVRLTSWPPSPFIPPEPPIPRKSKKHVRFRSPTPPPSIQVSPPSKSIVRKRKHRLRSPPPPLVEGTSPRKHRLRSHSPSLPPLVDAPSPQKRKHRSRTPPPPMLVEIPPPPPAPQLFAPPAVWPPPYTLSPFTGYPHIHPDLCTARLAWDLTRFPSTSHRPTPYTRARTAPDLAAPALFPPTSLLTISYTATPILAHWEHTWGPVFARAQGHPAAPLTVGDVLDAVFRYFNQPMTDADRALLTDGAWGAVSEACRRRISAHGSPHTPAYNARRGVLRVDVLERMTGFAGVECVGRDWVRMGFCVGVLGA